MNQRWRFVLRVGMPVGMVLLVGFFLFLNPHREKSFMHTTTQLHMGTLVAISTWNVSPQQEARALRRAFAEIARIEEQMSLHRPTSEVTLINQVPRGTFHPISGALGRLLQDGLAIGRRSGGAFAMGLEPLTTLWGFSSEQGVIKPPAEQARRDWLDHYPVQGGLTLQEDAHHAFQLRLENDGVGLDLGGIAKGYAIDRAIAVLRQEGVKNAMVDAGGDLRIIGSKGEKPWRIGLQHPRHTQQVIAVSQLKGDIAMVTSGDYERFFLHQGARYHHLLDPRTANPARSGLSSVSVQAKTATLADALSTAIFVLGAEEGLALLRHFPGSEALLITESGDQKRSPGFIGEWLGTP